MRIGRHDIEISNRDKTFFPDHGFSKGDLVDYYLEVADHLIRHARHYGVNMHRFPDGITASGFFQKDAPDYFPDWLTTAEIAKREGGAFRAPVIDCKATLAYLADQALITPHLYLSRIDDLEHPDRMIFDLDPPEGREESSAAVRRAARDMREVLAEVGLEAWVQTTGSKGFHLVVPLDREADFEEVRQFAADVAKLLQRRQPERYTLEQRKDRRQGKIFLDTLRNAYGATAVAPYAVRALPGAPVATPLDWEEVAGGATPQQWTIASVPRRLGQKDDPWAGLMRHARSLSGRRQQLDDLLAAEAGENGENGS